MASAIGWDLSSLRLERTATSRKRSRTTTPLPNADASARRDGPLFALIEGEIIPRMMASHPAEPDDHRARPDAAITDDDVDAFAPLALTLEADALLGLAERILHRGVSVDTLLVDLLAPTARRLGEYWEDDRCDFVDVTMGLWRLQELVHHLMGNAPCACRTGGRRALFAAMPGDQHSFGTVVIDEIFRRAGWDTLRIGDADPMELIGRVAGEWFDLVGLTVSCGRHVPGLRSLITAMRNVSRNPRACVMVGGRIFVDNPELAVNVGADGTARDARAAAAIAARLVDAQESRSIACG